MNPPSDKKPSHRRILRVASIASLVVIVLVLLYALAGFLIAPWLAQRGLPKFAQEHLQRRAQIENIRFNPFTLELRARGFALEESDGRPLLGFREATANLEWRSLARRGWVLSDLRLTEPTLNVEISKDGRLNLAALAPQTGAKKPSLEPARVAVEHIVVENGRIDFADQREGYKNRLEHLSLDLSAISTLDAKNGPYALTAQTPDGTRLRWNGELSLQPLAASGVVALDHSALPQLNPYLDNQIAAHITSGRVNLELPYRFSVADGKPQFEIRGGKLLLQDVALVARGADSPFAKFGRLAVEGVTVDLQARRASTETLRVADFSVAANRDEKGGLDLARLLLEKKENEAKPAAWQLKLGAAEFSNGSVSFDDRASGLALRLEQLSAKLGGISSDPAQSLDFELAAAVANGGRVAANGQTTPQSGALEVHVEASGIPLAPLQALVAGYAPVKLVSGELALAGDVRAAGEGPKFAYTGSATLSNVAIDDAAQARLLAWKSLSTKSLRATPGGAEIDELRWVAPSGRLAIAADGTTNVSRLFARKEAEGAPGTVKDDARKEGTPAPQTAKEGKKADGEEGFVATVRRVRVEQGQLQFSDESLSPGFSARIHELSGTLNGISTDRNTRSQVALEGAVDESGFARVSGSLNVFEPSERTNVRVQLRNLNVASVSPYTVKFAGYRVASGGMSLDLNYRVSNNLLEGDNKIVLEHFTLGEKVESPNALKLPLELAVALLKDSNGVIDLAIPISGNLNDPNFDFGAIIWKAIGNLVTNVISAPFRMLGRLFGGGEGELGAIAFDPGSSRLLPPERDKIKRIVEALAKRPELKLVIPARYDAEADARALKRGALRRELAKRAGFDVADEDPPGPLSIDDQRTRDALRALFAERFSDAELDKLKAEAEAKAAAGGAQEKKPAEISVLDRLRKLARGEPQVADATEFYRALGRRLIETQPLPDGALDQLAQKRAGAIAAALKEAGVDDTRVSQSKAEPTSNADAKQVMLQLALAPMK
jgi:hypothetical protein